jgi:hypothetical protein
MHLNFFKHLLWLKPLIAPFFAWLLLQLSSVFFCCPKLCSVFLLLVSFGLCIKSHFVAISQICRKRWLAREMLFQQFVFVAVSVGEQQFLNFRRLSFFWQKSRSVVDFYGFVTLSVTLKKVKRHFEVGWRWSNTQNSNCWQNVLFNCNAKSSCHVCIILIKILISKDTSKYQILEQLFWKSIPRSLFLNLSKLIADPLHVLIYCESLHNVEIKNLT